MSEIKPPAKAPCGSCPYRQDVPSGIWSREEYVKLIEYDKPTEEQPWALFRCHQADGRICAGWAGCHDMDNNMALRIHAAHLPKEVVDAIRDYESSVPLFDSGLKAATHGLRDELPGPRAQQIIGKLTRLRKAQ